MINKCKVRYVVIYFGLGIGAYGQQPGIPTMTYGCNPPSTCPVPMPVIEFSADKTIVQPGETVTFAWAVQRESGFAAIFESTSNIAEVVMPQFGLGIARGQAKYQPKQNTVYILVAGQGDCAGRKQVYIQMATSKLKVRWPKGAKEKR